MPWETARHVIGRSLLLGQHHQHRLKASLVVLQEGIDASREIMEWCAVPRQNGLHGKIADELERTQIIAQRVAKALGVQPDVRADALQHVITGNQHLGLRLVETNEPGRVSRRPDHLEVIRGPCEQFASFEDCVRLAFSDTGHHEQRSLAHRH